MRYKGYFLRPFEIKSWCDVEDDGSRPLTSWLCFIDERYCPPRRSGTAEKAVIRAKEWIDTKLPVKEEETE